MIGSPRPLPDFALEVYLERREFEARYDLCGSDCESWSIEEILAFGNDDDRKRWSTMRLGYIPVQGSPELRDAIAGSYEAIAPDDVLCFAGAQEGIFCAMHALLEPGDDAVVLVPGYQSAESLPAALANVRAVSLEYRDGWHLDLARVEAALGPKTKLLAVNFPNNPTGCIPDRATFDALVGLCRARGTYLLSDEVYRGIELDRAKQLPQAADLYERALSLNVVSKAYGLAGLRVGWIATRERALIERMTKLKHYLSICNAAPSELLATIAIRARAAIFERNRAIVACNLPLLDDFFARHAGRFEWYHPDGGCVAFPRYTGAASVDAFCEDLLERAGVLLLPGSTFESPHAAVPHGRFRIGFGRASIEPHLRAFDRYLESA